VFSNPLVRRALADAIDRNALNQAVLAGQFVPNNQFRAPHTTYWDPDHPVPPADVARVKRCWCRQANRIRRLLCFWGTVRWSSNSGK
jgi:ABC-type oligopeptide transport system substrate-binding subunit